jgi:predicted DNA-binding protein YlxM (UPF0122 family)
MDETQFKKQNKFPLCSKSPIEYLIPFKERQETLLKIRNEVIDAYGEDISGECPKRRVCFGDCLGRPLFWKSATALPYLQTLVKSQSEQPNEILATGCNTCEIKTTCSKTCPTVNDMLNKNLTPEPRIVYKSIYNEEDYSPIDNSNKIDSIKNITIPWDVLDIKKADLVKEYLYNERDFKYVANKFGLSNQSAAKRELYSAINKLTEFARMRDFINNNPDKLNRKNQYEILYSIYHKNEPINEVANRFGISKQAVSNLISRTIKDNNIKIDKFMVEKDSKLIFNGLEIFK